MLTGAAEAPSALRADVRRSREVPRAPDPRPVMRAALAGTWRAALLRVSRLASGPLRVRAPDRLLFAPQDLRARDAAAAAGMTNGLFAFGGHTVARAGASPFEIPPPGPDWTRDLYGFGWLRDLRASDTAAARTIARTLVGSAIERHRRDFARAPARDTAVAARRLIAFLAHSPLLLTGADHRFYTRYLARIGQDAAWLGRDMREAARPLDRLTAAIASCFAGLCCAGFERRLRRANRLLAAELDRQILPDGGHLDRNPATLVALLLDLLPLRLLYASRALPTPPALDRAIDLMLPMVRFLRVGSGELGHFNGMGRTMQGELSALLAQERDRPATLRRAPASGYDRLEAGSTIVLVETGAAPALESSASAAAGCLSLEISSGTDRLVVNGGAPDGTAAIDSRPIDSRVTAAQSTLGLGGLSCGRPVDMLRLAAEPWAVRSLARRFGPVLVGGPREVGAELGATAEGDRTLTAHQDGYRAAFGATHTRRLRLAADGGELEGEDVLAYEAGTADTSHPAVLRFHLHPAVRAGLEEGGGGVVMQLPSGLRWRFGAEGALPRLEPSLVYAVPEGRRATRQIVVDLPPAREGRLTSLRWIFLRA